MSIITSKLQNIILVAIIINTNQIDIIMDKFKVNCFEGIIKAVEHAREIIMVKARFHNIITHYNHYYNSTNNHQDLIKITILFYLLVIVKLIIITVVFSRLIRI